MNLFLWASGRKWSHCVAVALFSNAFNILHLCLYEYTTGLIHDLILFIKFCRSYIANIALHQPEVQESTFFKAACQHEFNEQLQEIRRNLFQCWKRPRTTHCRDQTRRIPSCCVQTGPVVKGMHWKALRDAIVCKSQRVHTKYIVAKYKRIFDTRA